MAQVRCLACCPCFHDYVPHLCFILLIQADKMEQALELNNPTSRVRAAQLEKCPASALLCLHVCLDQQSSVTVACPPTQTQEMAMAAVGGPREEKVHRGFGSSTPHLSTRRPATSGSTARGMRVPNGALTSISGPLPLNVVHSSSRNGPLVPTNISRGGVRTAWGEADAKTGASRPGSSVGGRPGSSVGGRQGTSVGGRPGTHVGSRASGSFGGRPGSAVGGRPGTSAGGRLGMSSNLGPGTGARNRPGTAISSSLARVSGGAGDGLAQG